MPRLVSILLLVFVIALTGCGSKSNPSSNSPLSVPEESSSSSSSQMEIRAIGTINSGEILVIPKTNETIEKLEAPSCLGKAEDYLFKSDYEVMFKDKDDNESVIKLPKIDTFIRPDNTQITLPTLDFKEFQAVVIAPQYTDCHGVSFYLIGAKDNDVFPFKFITDECASDSFHYASNTQLKVINDQLVIQPGQAAGSETKKELIFKPDLKEKAMRLVQANT
ncbi:hypothetical protein [Paenibacillus sp. GCM10027626]|uniref:hypothetical protein n=1 Tax=Paenibacillus sp. GCM10027626 TaxID=3273411 RepID=UPI00364531D6